VSTDGAVVGTGRRGTATVEENDDV
jgi:hypothetical protein